MGLAQLVPQFFQADGRRVVPVCPQQRDQFSKDAYTALTPCCSRDDAPNDLGEALRLWQSINHELRQQSVRIDRDVLPLGRSNLQPLSLQSLLKALSVRLCGQNDAGIPRL